MRFDYLARRLEIQHKFKCDDEIQLIKQFYCDEMLSGYEISERFKEAGISITARSIQRLLAKYSLLRKKGDAFRLAAKKGRIHWAYKNPILKIKRKTMSSKLRYFILKRDGFKCTSCGQDANTSTLEVDHILAVCKGGKDEISNLRTYCHECNIGKRDEENERWKNSLTSTSCVR